MKNKKVTNLLIILMAFSMLIMTGCGKKNGDSAKTSESETTEVADSKLDEPLPEVSTGTDSEAEKAEQADDASEGDAFVLPPYEFPGYDPIDKAVFDYVMNEIGSNYQGDIGIPCPVIFNMDRDNLEDIKVYADFWYFTYERKGDTLVSQAGGSHPGVLHLKQDAEGNVEVLSFDAVEDGSNMEESAKKIFGDFYERYQEVTSDDNVLEQTRAYIIADYVHAAGAKITKYQDYGQDPVELPE